LQQSPQAGQSLPMTASLEFFKPFKLPLS